MAAWPLHSRSGGSRIVKRKFHIPRMEAMFCPRACLCLGSLLLASNPPPTDVCALQWAKWVKLWHKPLPGPAQSLTINIWTIAAQGQTAAPGTKLLMKRNRVSRALVGKIMLGYKVCFFFFCFESRFFFMSCPSKALICTLHLNSYKHMTLRKEMEK